MKRGRPPKSAEQKRLEGNPGKRPIVDTSIDATGELSKPVHIRDYAGEVWDNIVDSMPEGYFKLSDRELLAAYCVHSELLKRSFNKLRRAKLNPNDTKSPLFVIIQQCTGQIENLGQKLGLEDVKRPLVAPNKTGGTGSKFSGLRAIDGSKNDAE